MDIHFTFSPPFQFSLTKSEVPFPVLEIESLNDFWEENRSAILHMFKDILGLEFKTDSLTCYLNSEFSVSDPLCLKIEDVEDMKDNLIHELTHIILTQNEYSKTSAWKQLMETYSGEHPTVKVHTLIHRVHYLITQKLFPHRLDRIQTYSIKPRYVRAWELATKEAAKIDTIIGFNS